MVVVPLTKPAGDPRKTPAASESASLGPGSLVAAGALAASAVLLLTGRRRAGVAVAAAGTTLLMLDQQEVLRAWWNALPGYIGEVQGILGRVQTAVDDLSAQRDRLHRILDKEPRY